MASANELKVLTSRWPVREGQFAWRLENFHAFCGGAARQVSSPEFELAGRRWIIRVVLERKGHPAGDTKAGMKNITHIGAQLLSRNESNVRAALCLSTTDDIDESDMEEVAEFPAGAAFVIDEFISIADALGAQEYKDNHAFVVHLKMKTFGEVQSTFLGPAPNSSGPTVGQELHELFFSGLDSDATLKAQGDDVPVHSFVLRLRSPVFRKMLDSCMAEGRTSTIELLEEHAVVRAFARFLYTDYLDEGSTDMCCHLLRLGHRYEISALTQRCTARIIASLTSSAVPEAVVEWLMLADEVAMEDLKTNILRFLIGSGMLAEAQSTEPWARLTKHRAHLLAEVVNAMVPAKRPHPKEGGQATHKAAKLAHH
eukprot:TRINITY_DN90425_c0_g1_i1.p1 TRINITY_DN90425_c0_g1~~TRINITY_DN90425_c0_g1_i1.p1  ORF type:complete len:370 (-),score=45.55 TRINITY_DN90425_c0_g1_i1:543-1652(-)